MQMQVLGVEQGCVGGAKQQLNARGLEYMHAHALVQEPPPSPRHATQDGTIIQPLHLTSWKY